ncbi:MAG: InlB B-repeat-containing protein, partial [Bacillota bacterium]
MLKKQLKILFCLLLCGSFMFSSVTAALAETDAGPAETETHSYYTGNVDPVKANYGKGDYVYDTIKITGSGIGKEMIFSVKDLETLALDENSGLGYKHIYSYRNSGGFYSSNVMTGIKLYDFLVDYCGMSGNLPDTTPITYYAVDGYSKTIKMRDLKYSKYGYYTDTEAAEAEFVGLPVMLSFAVGGTPLLGPTGDESVNKDFDENEGYLPEVNNIGGPIKITMGQKAADDYNAQKNGKCITKIVIGEDVNYNLHDESTGAKAALSVKVYDNGQLKTDVDYSVGDLEEFAMQAQGNRCGNYYDDGKYYEGVNIWQLVSNLDLPGYEGTVTFSFADNTQETLDLNYLRNVSGDFSGYTTVKDGLTLTCVRPIIAYAADGSPLADGSLLTLLPKNQTDKQESTAKICTEISLNVGAMDDIHKGTVYGSYAQQQIVFSGDGMKEPKTYTVAELEAMTSVIQGAVFGADNYRGLNLYKLLKALKITVDADKITVSSGGGQSLTYGLQGINALNSPLLVFSKNGKPLVSDRSSAGYDENAGNIGGPLLLLSPSAADSSVLDNSKTLFNVSGVDVGITEGLWVHTGDVYGNYGDSETLRIYGTEAKADTTIKLSDIESMTEGTVRDSFASSSGTFGYQGISLKYLIDNNLKNSGQKPSKITVIGDGGFTLEIDYALLEKPIESSYQPGESRGVIIAYAVNGLPMVKNESSVGYDSAVNNGDGPMRLIVENTISSWVKGVHTIIIGDKSASVIGGGGGGGTAAETFKVTFDTMGGSAVASQKVEAGEKISAPANPTRTGYTFKGW